MNFDDMFHGASIIIIQPRYTILWFFFDEFSLFTQLLVCHALLCNASLVVESICWRQRNGPKSKLQSALHIRFHTFGILGKILANFAIEVVFAFYKGGLISEGVSQKMCQITILSTITKDYHPKEDSYLGPFFEIWAKSKNFWN